MRIDELAAFGVSQSIIERLKELGFEVLTTAAQEDAIRKGLFDGKSLIISAPTNTGKTFIGELAALNASRQKDPKRSFFLVPLKALAEQMFQDFQFRYAKWGLKTAISTADHYEFDNELIEYDVVISTYEKLNSLLIKKRETSRDIGLVVVDEIQHIGDNNRGINLEMLLTRLRVFIGAAQIIGLSATISNAEKLADWLNCTLVNVLKRDVELREGITYTGSGSLKFRGVELNKGDFLYKEFNTGKFDVERELKLDIIDKVIELSQKEQCLVFLNTHAKAEDTAQLVARQMPELPSMKNLIEELDNSVETTSVTAKLKKVLSNSVAFHHGGLLADERRIVESGFRSGEIRIICATFTLAAGVNTPAKNVIIFFYHFYDQNKIPVSLYKNISGRAGRFRKPEEFGRSTLLASNERELEFLWDNYVNAKPERIVSQIAKQTGLDCSILGLVATKACASRKELSYCLEMTFYGYLISKETPTDYGEKISNRLNQEVDRLIKMGFIRENGKLEATELGLRCAEELLPPETVLFLYQMLKMKEEQIQKATEYESLLPGIIHLCCSTNGADRTYYPRSQTEVQELMAIYTLNPESYFCGPEILDFIRSMRTTRMLLRWIEGIPYNELTQYGDQGTIKRIAENIQWMARGLARLAEKPLFSFRDAFIDYLFELSERIYFGVPENALPIMRLRIQGIHRRRAMNLVKAGYDSIDKLLETDIEDLKSVADIGDILALRIKESIEGYIAKELERKKSFQVRLAMKMGKDTNLILGFYNTHGDDLSRHIARIFNEELKINAEFVGLNDQHGPDIIVYIDEGKIAIEVKRSESGRVSAKESEEIIGKGAKYKPIANVTVGYPDFVDVAKQNAVSSRVTLITSSVLGELLIKFWAKEIDVSTIIALLKSGKPVYELGQNNLEHV